jgi:hypothetical protein
VINKERCKWTTEGDPDITIWHETSCNESFYTESGTYKDIGFKYCPFCGKEIEGLKDEI